jgi:hypothetical protein
VNIKRPPRPGLTDADWAEINKLKVAYSQGGKRAFDRALRRLEKDHPIRYAAVVRAFFFGHMERSHQRRDGGARHNRRGPSAPSTPAPKPRSREKENGFVGLARLWMRVLGDRSAFPPACSAASRIISLSWPVSLFRTRSRASSRATGPGTGARAMGQRNPRPSSDRLGNVPIHGARQAGLILN